MARGDGAHSLAVLAISAIAGGANVYARLLPAGGIPIGACSSCRKGAATPKTGRYHLIDFVLDPVPYSGVHRTLEALGMGVPVVTLCGRKHCERVVQHSHGSGRRCDIAHSANGYVDIAVQLATDASFAAEVRAAIRAGIAKSPLTDMPAHTRNLERAYLEALRRRVPEALTASGNGQR
jgi:hypothetical protein